MPGSLLQPHLSGSQRICGIAVIFQVPPGVDQNLPRQKCILRVATKKAHCESDVHVCCGLAAKLIRRSPFRVCRSSIGRVRRRLRRSPYQIMSRVLRGRQLARCCALLLRSGAAAESHVPPARSPPLPVLTPCEGSAAWLPACFARGSFAASTAQQRGVATASGGEPPSSEAPPNGARAGTPTGPATGDQSSSAADGKQRRGPPHSGGGGGESAARSDSAARGGGPQRPSQAGGGQLEATSGIDSDERMPPGDGAGSADGGGDEGSGLSLVVPGGQLEGEIDEMLDAWDPLMAEVCLDNKPF